MPDYTITRCSVDTAREARPAPPRNSPLAVVSTLVLVLGLVLSVALAGRSVTPVAGVAVPASPEAVDRMPHVPGVPTVSVARPEPVPVAELGTNPLLADGVVLPDVTCELPGIGRNSAELRAFYEAALTCLDDAWEPVLSGVDEPFAIAGLELTDRSPSECGEPPGKAEATAFYCGFDEVIYMPEDRLLATVGLNRAGHLAVLAHEWRARDSAQPGPRAATPSQHRSTRCGDRWYPEPTPSWAAFPKPNLPVA
jgi:hypothetical protein